jgi:hypothetical protein
MAAIKGMLNGTVRAEVAKATQLAYFVRVALGNSAKKFP